MDGLPAGGMRRVRGVRALGRLDRTLLLVLVPLWVLSFSLHVREVVRSQLVWPWVWVERAADPGAGPTLVGVWPQFVRLAPGLEPGDRILRVGERSAAGFGPVGFAAAALASADAGRRVPLEVERGGQVLARTLTLGASPTPWVFAAISLPFALVGTLILLYAPRAQAARPAFLAGITYGLYYAFFYGPDPWQTHVSLPLLVATGSLTGPLAVRAMLALSETRTGRLPRWPWLLALSGPLYSSLILGTPLSPTLGQILFPLGTAALALCLAGVVVRDYRAADAVGRRKLRWVLYGVYLGTFPFGLGWLAYLFEPALLPLTLYSLAAALFLPLGFLIAIVRHNLLDIDRLISATASYSVLSVLFVAGALTLVPRASRAASSALGVDPDTGQLVLSLALAAIAVPLQRRLRPHIDRMFFAERAQIDRGARELLAELATRDSAGSLVECVGRGLARTFRPEACAVYVRGERAYLPVFVAGGSAAPAVPLDSPLIALLAHVDPVLMLDPEPSELRRLGGRARAMLDSLGALAIVPVQVEKELTAFACLGPKRSGDVYTPTDLAWLVALREAVRRELRRLDHSELLREAERRQASFRRYVPGAIAEELESGADLEVGEREVSVLFVDIRGYTAYAEGRAAEEIFSMINRYTHVVSQIVRAHGGSVVEFNGDGMMAVFGAPRELPARERAAVDAGLAIVGAVRTLPGEALSVGVGIASGLAYVGNIRAEDRLIWSAIGNTTNLAARLQTLTRELDAAIVIDVATWKAAGESATSFREHAAVRIRNRSGSQTVYARAL